MHTHIHIRTFGLFHTDRNASKNTETDVNSKRQLKLQQSVSVDSVKETVRPAQNASR